MRVVAGQARRSAFGRKYLDVLLPTLAGALAGCDVDGDDGGSAAGGGGGERVHAVKFAVDVSLAVAAGGGRRWSRALLNRSVRVIGARKRSRNCGAARPANQRAPRVRGGGRYRVIRRRSSKRRRGSDEAEEAEEEAEAEEEEEVMRIRRLRELVIPSSSTCSAHLHGQLPRHAAIDLPTLLDETADYILALQSQVDALQLLTNHALSSAPS